MKTSRHSTVFAVLAVALLATLVAPNGARAQEFHEKPKIRALTAFVALDRAKYRGQIVDALHFLHQLKSACEQSGYEVQTMRITTQPFPEYTRDLSPGQTIAFFREYNALAMKEGFDASIGPAMMKDDDNPGEAALLAQIIAATTTLEGSVVVAGEDGVHWKAVRAAAGIVKYLEDNTAHSQGNFNFAATALVPAGTPFYPASYANGDHQFGIGLQSANVVAEALRTARDPAAAEKAIVDALAPHARAIEAVAKRVATQTGWTYLGMDTSPVPLKEISIGGAIERFTGARMGSSGTLTAAALITRAVRSLPIQRIGYSGLMLPVLEDSVIAQRWSEGALSLDALLAYSSVCGTGIDVAPLPGAISREQVERIIGDVATLAVKLQKPLSARLLPVAGKKSGDHTEFEDPFLVNATLQPLP